VASFADASPVRALGERDPPQARASAAVATAAAFLATRPGARA
jgi:hypothetical protein